jgi:hypothetical protein
MKIGRDIRETISSRKQGMQNVVIRVVHYWYAYKTSNDDDSFFKDMTRRDWVFGSQSFAATRFDYPLTQCHTAAERNQWLHRSENLNIRKAQ